MSEHTQTDQFICDEIVTKIAQLARLRLTEEEAKQYRENFADLMQLFHELDSLNISEDTSSALSLNNANDCREDLVMIPNNDAIEQASPHYNLNSHYFDVPQFIEYKDE